MVACGPAEFFQEPPRLLDAVARLANKHEGDARQAVRRRQRDADSITAQLRGIVGMHIPLSRFDGKRNMSQNRPEVDRVGVAAGLLASEN